MKKILVSFFVVAALYLFTFKDEVSAEPEYAKWGKIAVQETLNKYHTSITEYLHLGRTQIDSNISEEKFKLILKSGNKEFGVIVSIRFQVSNEQVISITFHEVGQP
ncbi:DUF3889 domain-containing protein [Paenibacillus sp. KN14-4R]|uniref:DUF3889 domain-containing protein n=1 Tax=Paenibacillus sp. KN14-4R TaxID=3445773 RepID=UPI003F9FC1AA